MPAQLRRPLAAAVVLLGVYVLLSLLMDPRGSLGTDTGAKLATLEAMERADTARPVVGYWAARWDPDGLAHPLYQSGQNEDGEWVAVTTLPMLEAARPLYGWGGYRATLLLAMLGSLGCALGAWALVRRVSDDDGWLAFWVIGLGSPMLIYALDFWEHSLGVAATVGGVVLLLDAAGERPRWWHAATAGVLFGGAATLRTEAFVYTLVAVGLTCAAVAVRTRKLARPIWIGSLAVAGFAVPWLANRWLEDVLGGQSRTERASDAAGAVGSHLGDRISQSLVTTFGMKGEGGGSIVIGLAVVAAVLVAMRAERRGDRTFAMFALGLAVVPFVAAAATDLSFIPGMFVAFPLGLAALTMRRRDNTALVVAIALASMPIVWAFQYVAGGGPQWGGRYTLTSSVLLGAVATIGLLQRHPVVGRGLLAISVGVAALSVVWLGTRSRSVDDLFDDLTSVEADVLVARNGFLLREGGAATVGRHWLSVDNEETFQLALEVAERSGARTVAVLEYDGIEPPAEAIPAGWVVEEQLVTDLTGTPIGVVTYRLP